MGKIILIFVYLLLNSCVSDKINVMQGKTMGTSYLVKTMDVAFDQTKINARLDAINAIFSTWDENSELSRLNQQPVAQWVELPQELLFVLAEAKKIYTQTHGAFDPGIGRLIDVWGFGMKKTNMPPTNLLIQAALKNSSIQYLQLGDGKAKKLKDIQLNLSAIAKGYAVDAIAKLLSTAGVEQFLVEIGGEVKSQGKVWRVGIEKPNSKTPITIGLINQAIASSGDYRNYFVWQGKKYQHILNPKTGLPAKTDLSSASVMHQSAIMADAYATAMMAMGSKEATTLAQQLNLSTVLILNQQRGFKVVKINL